MLEAAHGITDTLRASGVFNDIVLNMCDTGERTGNLDLMLDKLSKYYEEEATTRSIQMAYLLGVVMLLVVGAYVGYIYISNLAGIGDTYREAADGAASWIVL
jgi:type II secretory pathway component PulF